MSYQSNTDLNTAQVSKNDDILPRVGTYIDEKHVLFTSESNSVENLTNGLHLSESSYPVPLSSTSYHHPMIPYYKMSQNHTTTTTTTTTEEEEEEEGKKDSEEDNMVVISATKVINKRSQTHGKVKLDDRNKKRYKTYQIALKNSKSVSDIKTLTKDVTFRFNVLKPRPIKLYTPNIQRMNDDDNTTSVIPPASMNINTFVDTVLTEVNHAVDYFGDKNQQQQQPPRETKTLLELTFDHVDKFYSEGFDIPKKEINKEASGSNVENLDSIPISFAKTMRTRLYRMYLMANINENYEFDVNAETRCTECIKTETLRSSYQHSGQCKKCEKEDVLKLMNAVEFFVLACRHQYAGTLQVLIPPSDIANSTTGTPTMTTTITTDEDVIYSSVYLTDDEEQDFSSSHEGDSDNYGDETSDYESEHGDAVIPISGVTSSSMTQKRKTQHQRGIQRQQKQQSHHLDELGPEASCLQQ